MIRIGFQPIKNILEPLVFDFIKPVFLQLNVKGYVQDGNASFLH